MTALAQHLVLRQEHAVNSTHQATALAVQVTVDLLLKGGLVHVACADGNTERDGLLLGLAGHVLVDGDRRVDAAALAEERAHCAAGTLWCDEDYVNVGWDLDLGLALEDGGETVGEVKSLAR